MPLRRRNGSTALSRRASSVRRGMKSGEFGKRVGGPQTEPWNIPVNTRDLTDTFSTLLGELVDGTSATAAYILNAGDSGLLRSLDTLTAADASSAVAGGASIAAHVDHLRYRLSLMNRWSAGEKPFLTADWSASWRKTSVSEREW